MHAGVAHRAFELVGIGENLLYAAVAIHLGLELRQVANAVGHCLLELFFLVRVVGVDGHMGRYHLGEHVCRRYRVFHHARHVLDGELGCHGAVCYDMGHVGSAVTVCHIVEHEFAPVVVEVDVDIRKRYTVRVEEAFKQQVVLQRVDLRYAEAVCHHRACGRASTRPDAYAQCATYADKVLHDKEVTRETHRLHYV